MTHDLTGVLPVLETPFSADERALDLDSLAREIDFVFDAGADGVVIGLLSEVLRLSDTEQQALVEETCAIAAGRGPVIASVGAEATAVAERRTAAAEAAGASAVMAIPPVSVACSETELRRYYDRIAGATALPIVIQDASNYVGQGLSISGMAALHRDLEERVLFKPEALPVGLRLGMLLEATGGEARVYDGTGGVALVECFYRGLIGTMPGAEMTKPVRALWLALRGEEHERVRRIQGALACLFDVEGTLDGYIVIGKHLLYEQGVISSPAVRSPIDFRMDAALADELGRLMGEIDAAVESGSSA